MNAARIDVGRLETICMPATAQMTAWPEETAVPTTRGRVEVCSFNSPSLYTMLGSHI